MRDMHDIFKEKLLHVQKVAFSFNFKGCTRISTDLITTSIMFEYDDGVFIAEVLEGVFDQLNKLAKRYELNDSDKKLLKGIFEKSMYGLVNSFTSSDKNGLYASLKMLRYETTKMQYKCIQNPTMKRIPSLDNFVVET